MALRSVMIIRPKSPRRTVPVSSTRMFAYKTVSDAKTVQTVGSHSFEISVRNPKFVKVDNTSCDLGKLRSWSSEHRVSQGMDDGTHQMQTVGLRIGANVFHHIPVGHPLGDDTEMSGVFRHGDSQQWQDVRVGQPFPDENFSTKSLGWG
jgi:hypothetical protein